jgi:hypothetical protein
MSSRDYPQRVFALQSADAEKVYSFGVGTYVGDKRPPWVPETPDEATAACLRKQIEEDRAVPLEEHWLYLMTEDMIANGTVPEDKAEAKRAQTRKVLTEERAKPVEERIQELYLQAFGSNPCIELDSGDTVWGAQCWWGPEERLDEKVQGREVVLVPVPEGNKRWRD